MDSYFISKFDRINRINWICFFLSQFPDETVKTQSALRRKLLYHVHYGKLVVLDFF